MSFSHTLESLVAGQDLSPDDARTLMRFLMGGEATDAQIAGVLVALRVKGATAQELASFAGVMREHASRLETGVEGLVDTCGTGGGCPTFNISTAAAIVAASAGAKVAKHGNRAVTSACGSSDVLEALGVRLIGEPARLLHILEELGIVFLFAPSHHPAMRHVGPARKQLGVRTVFNQLGPLSNPAGARRQLIGVYDAEYLRPMAEALALLDIERAFLVHADDGLDEVSPCSGSRFVKVWEGKITEGRVDTFDFGLERVDPKWLQPGLTAAENGEILLEAISNADSPRASVILPSAAMALVLGGVAGSLIEGAKLAREAIGSGAALAKLNALIEATAAP